MSCRAWLVSVDTRNGVVEGHVSRLDPAVQAGTVLADVTFNGAPLPRGARPDLSVEGTVELERIPDTLVVNRPAFGREESTVGLFRLSADGTRGHARPGPTRARVGQRGRGARAACTRATRSSFPTPAPTTAANASDSNEGKKGKISEVNQTPILNF